MSDDFSPAERALRSEIERTIRRFPVGADTATQLEAAGIAVGAGWNAAFAFIREGMQPPPCLRPDPFPWPRFHLLRPSLFTHRHKDTHR